MQYHYIDAVLMNQTFPVLEGNSKLKEQDI